MTKSPSFRSTPFGSDPVAGGGDPGSTRFNQIHAVDFGRDGPPGRPGRSRTARRVLALSFALPTLACAIWAADAPEKTHLARTVTMRKMADSLHAVIVADQKIYVEQVAQKRPSAGDTPSHAEMLRKASQAIQKKGAEFSYTLRSLTPINPNSGPQTEGEQTGLAFVTKRPDEAYYTEEELGGRSYFTAVYAERATLTSCVDCHNQQPGSPRKDWKTGDVMGAIVVRVPLEF